MPSLSIRSLPADLPVLRLGLAGFSQAEQASLVAALALRTSRNKLIWQLAPLSDADAWFVNGARVQNLPDGTVRIAPGFASGRSIRINLAEIDWPVAFSLPLASPDFKPAYLFRPDSPDSIQSVLRHLEDWLRPLVMQFHLASQILERNLDLRSGVYHVSVQGKLHAMVSQRHGIGVWPIADPADLANATWSHRPDSAGSIPNTFVRVEFPELMWQYAGRTSRDCLPPHYRTRPLFLRRPPQLPVRLLNDSSLLLVRELGYMHGTFAELAGRTGLSDAALSRQLGALYMVGAITADPKRAPPPQAIVEGGAWNSSFSPSSSSSVSGTELTVRLKVSSPKAPAVRQ